MRIVKADSSGHYIIGVVYEPDVVDSQGDSASAEEIRKAMERYNAGPKHVGYMHRRVISPERAEVLDSWMHKGGSLYGQPVKAGAWLMKIAIKDPDLWGEISEKKMKGLSMGGRARDAYARKMSDAEIIAAVEQQLQEMAPDVSKILRRR